MNRILKILILSAVCGIANRAGAQLCAHPADTIYGLNSITGSGSGQIVGVNVNNAGTSTIGSPPAGTSTNANGLGYSAINNRFYFFNQTGGGATEFISFAPGSGTKVTLAAPPATITTAQKIRTGTVDSAGARYYTLNPNAASPFFYYYSIGANTWTTITSTFKDKNGNTITDFKNLNSGDMTFDGKGNLWVLCSNTSQFSLYKIKAPVPTTAVASITADTILPLQSVPVAGVSFTGIAFNSAGALFLTTGSGAGPGNNKLYKLATPTSPMTLVGSVTNGYGDDLTSCSYPVAVLGVCFTGFTAQQRNHTVNLTWQTFENGMTLGYDIQSSTDAAEWKTIGHQFTATGYTGAGDYQFADPAYSGGRKYYRVIRLETGGKQSVSETRMIDSRFVGVSSIGPNPVQDKLYLYGGETTTTLLARIYDANGRLAASVVVGAEQRSIDVGRLKHGSYILKLTNTEGGESPGYHFLKW